MNFFAQHPPGVFEWLTVSALLFSIGLYGMLTRRNAVGIFISVELALNSAALNFVIFNRFFAPAAVDGEVMAIFVIAIAAAEVVVALAILVFLFKQARTVDVTQIDRLRDDPKTIEMKPDSFSEFVPFLSKTHGGIPEPMSDEEEEEVEGDDLDARSTSA